MVIITDYLPLPVAAVQTTFVAVVTGRLCAKFFFFASGNLSSCIATTETVTDSGGGVVVCPQDLVP